jgi:7-cyano-7-deazaguanine synthase in queuosine biosynthesis
MPRNEHLVLCGGLVGPRKGSASSLSLNLHGTSPNVHLRISDISKLLVANIPDVLVDLLEVASYVYAADSAISRGGRMDAQMGKRWRRNFRFVIPVRRPDLWSSDPVSSALVETLSFLSEDEYELEFRSLDNAPVVEDYFEFPDSELTGFTPDEVILFSGGLDSLAGAVEELVAHGKKVALVSHRSARMIVSAQKHLVEELRSRVGPDRMLHVPVWAHLVGSLGGEPTHRTRSFLFAALGAVTARLFGIDRINFFENGVVSLNLPPVAQVVGARATRTTHPQALAGFRRVLAEVLERPFEVENPFTWLTKAEVVERISANGYGNLIRRTRSCTRVRDMTKLHPHCGQCSQCIDRRFAVLAAGQEHEDPAEAYKVDLLLGGREPGPDREMALAYVRSASAVKQMEDIAFFTHYGETSRIFGFFPESADTVASRIIDLHRRHASSVCRVFDDAISANASVLREANLPADCLISLIIGKRGAMTAYPERRGALKQTVTIGSDIRMATDKDKKRVVFDRWGEISGLGAELIITLAEPFREAMREERTPENYPFIEAQELVRLTNCGADELLRKRVMRCRNKIKQQATNAGDPPPSTDDVIENSQWHGYRLNTDPIRIVALSELSLND